VKEKVDLGIWTWLTQAVVALIAIAALLLIMMAYLPEIRKNQNMRKELDRLETDLAQQKQVSDQLQMQLSALRNDPKTVERLAREKLGYAKPDETVVRFETNGAGR